MYIGNGSKDMGKIVNILQPKHVVLTDAQLVTNKLATYLRIDSKC